VLRYLTYQSNEGLCRRDSQPSYNAPLGPNWPFIDNEGCHLSLASGMTHTRLDEVVLGCKEVVGT
jgi:hypothetical protein